MAGGGDIGFALAQLPCQRTCGQENPDGVGEDLWGALGRAVGLVQRMGFWGRSESTMGRAFA